MTLESEFENIDLSPFSQAIIEDNGVESIQSVGRLTDSDDLLRLTESQVEAILDYDRAVAKTWLGKKVVVEVVPDHDKNAPVEIREVDDE